MGYFGALSERNQSGREDRLDRYRYYRFRKEIMEEETEQDDWAFEERD